VQGKLKVLLVQLGSTGDCLFVTTIARQIKEVDYPGCHLTWMIGSKYKPAILNNPHVDEILGIPMHTIDDLNKCRDDIPNIVNEFQRERNFDKVFITDHTPGNYDNFYGTTRTSLFRGYPHKVTVPVEPVLDLLNEEIEQVNGFVSGNKLKGNKFNIMFECSPQSAQSNMNLEMAYNISRNIIKKFPFVKIILSSHNKLTDVDPGIVDGSVLTWRENAELTKSCHLLIGCSSGISWLNTSNGSAKIPMIQSVNPTYYGAQLTASLKIDFQYFGLSTEKLIEIANPTEKELVDCVSMIIEKGFSKAYLKYKNYRQIRFFNRSFLFDILFKRGFAGINMDKIRLTSLLLRSYLHGKLSQDKNIS
jgi:hypothetical protein